MFDSALQAQVYVSRKKNGYVTVTKLDGYPDSKEDKFRIGFVPISLGSNPSDGKDDIHWMTLTRGELGDFIEALHYVYDEVLEDEVDE